MFLIQSGRKTRPKWEGSAKPENNFHRDPNSHSSNRDGQEEGVQRDKEQQLYKASPANGAVETKLCIQHLSLAKTF